MNDFHITFDKPPGKIKNSLTGNPFVDQGGNTLVSSGFNVGGAGSSGNTFSIIGLDVTKQANNGAKVLSWCWSLNGSCNDVNGNAYLQPKVKINLNDGNGIQSLYLNDLSTKGYTVSAVPIPSAAWLLGSSLVGLIGINRKLKLNA